MYRINANQFQGSRFVLFKIKTVCRLILEQNKILRQCYIKKRRGLKQQQWLEANIRSVYLGLCQSVAYVFYYFQVLGHSHSGHHCFWRAGGCGILLTALKFDCYFLRVPNLMKILNFQYFEIFVICSIFEFVEVISCVIGLHSGSSVCSNTQ